MVFIYSFMLKLDWYIELPHDFEYKNYILLDYLQVVDKSFQLHQLSPYLLWTEKLLIELQQFSQKQYFFLKQTERTQIKFIDGKISFVKTKIEDKTLKTVNEIVDYSYPILQSKVKLGYKLLEKYPQLLF